MTTFSNVELCPLRTFGSLSDTERTAFDRDQPYLALFLGEQSVPSIEVTSKLVFQYRGRWYVVDALIPTTEVNTELAPWTHSSHLEPGPEIVAYIREGIAEALVATVEE